MAFFFFFQAEDGIRDVAVTGVQTCALPISGGLVEQGFKCSDGGGSSCSVASFGEAALAGGAGGALGGALGVVGGKILGAVAPKALEAVGGPFGRGASGAARGAATDVGDAAARPAASSS